MITTRNDRDHYEQLLAETRDADGVCHKDAAVAQFVDELIADEERTREFAASHARSIADRFDRDESAKAMGDQLSFDENTWWVCGAGARVQSADMDVDHWDSWYAVQNQAFIASSQGHVAKTNDYYRYRAVMVEHGVSLLGAMALAEAA